MNGLLLSRAIVSFAISLVLVVVLTPAMRVLASRLGLVARPTNDRWHRKPVPMLGGLAVWLAASSSILVTAPATWSAAVFLIATACVVVVGLVDDVIRLKPATKLMAEIAIACGISVAGVTPPWTQWGVANAVITITWFAAITNSFNLLDNMDGLCAGVAAVSALSLVAITTDGNLTSLAGASLAGAGIGFLIYNFKPASVFLGDCGSLFFGSAMAILTLFGSAAVRRGVVSTLAVPVFLLLLPIFDSVFVTLVRKLSSRAASLGGRDHTSHRLVALGFSERQTVLLLYAFAALGGAAAITVHRAHIEAVPFASAVVVAIVLFGVYLTRVAVYDGADFALLRGRRYTPLLVEFAYKRRVFEVFLDGCLIVIAYYSSYVIRFDRNFDANEILLVQSLPVVLGVQLAALFVAGVYRGMWRYVSLADLATYGRGVALGVFGSVMALVLLYRFWGYSRMVFVIDAMLLVLLLLGSRISFRLLGDVASRHGPAAERALIYGAGDGGVLLVRELRNNPKYTFRPVGFIDDDSSKWGKRILGVPVIGGASQLTDAIRRYHPRLIILSTDKLPVERLSTLQEIASAGGTVLRKLTFALDELPSVRSPV